MSDKKIIELFGYEYEWDPDTRIITILSHNGKSYNRLKVHPPDHPGKLSSREQRNKKFYQPIYDQLVREKKIEVSSNSTSDEVDYPGLEIDSSNPELSIYEALKSKGHIFGNSVKLLIINGDTQEFNLLDSEANTLLSGNVSTGKKGFGNQNGSGKTSVGLMKVKSIIGKDQADYTVFFGKKPALNDDGSTLTLGPDQRGPKGHPACVLTRLLVLEGMQPGNKNVFDRNIYVHGTNVESGLGRAFSGGCVRVSNDHIKALADQMQPGHSGLVFVYSSKVPMEEIPNTEMMSSEDSDKMYASFGIDSDGNQIPEPEPESDPIPVPDSDNYDPNYLSKLRQATSSINESSYSFDKFYKIYLTEAQIVKPTIGGKEASDEEVEEFLKDFEPESGA